MTPHTQHFYSLLGFQHLIDEAMLNIDATGIGAGQITDQFFNKWGKGWWILIGVLAKDCEQFLGFGL